MPCSPCLHGTALTKRTAEWRCSLLSFVCWTRLLLIVGMDQKDFLHRARRRLRQWHVQGWFCWLLFALCSFLLSSGPRCFASWLVWTRRTVLRFSAVACARLVLLVMLYFALGSCVFVRPRCPASWPVRTTRTFTQWLVLLACFLSSGPRCSALWPERLSRTVASRSTRKLCSSVRLCHMFPY